MKLTPNGSGDPPHPQVPAATQGTEHHSTHLPALEHLFVMETLIVEAPRNYQVYPCCQNCLVKKVLLASTVVHPKVSI